MNNNIRKHDIPTINRYDMKEKKTKWETMITKNSIQLKPIDFCSLIPQIVSFLTYLEKQRNKQTKAN